MSKQSGDRHNEGGYTLVEAVVALALVAVIAGTVFAVYLVAARQVASWQAGFAATNELHLIQQRLATDLRQARSVTLRTPEAFEAEPGSPAPLTAGHALALVGADSTVVTYTRSTTALLRSARPMHGTALTLLAATVERITVDDEGIRVPLESAARPTTPILTSVQLTFVAGGDTTAITAQSLTRHPQAWPSDE